MNSSNTSLITASALLIVPGLVVAIRTLLGQVTFDGGSLFAWKLILTTLFITALGLFGWSSKRMTGGFRTAVLVLTLFHFVVIALLAYWYTGISHFFR